MGRSSRSGTAALNETHKDLNFYSGPVVRLIDFLDQRSEFLPAHEDYGRPSKEVPKSQEFTEYFDQGGRNYGGTLGRRLGHLAQQILVPRIGRRHLAIPLARNELEDLLDLGVLWSMAQAAAVSTTPTVVSDVVEIKSLNCSWTIVSSSSRS